MNADDLAGGCQCGAVRYHLLRRPMFVNCCHCRECQAIGGSAFALNGMVEADAVRLIVGETAAVGNGFQACAACATLLWTSHRLFGSGILFVRLGTLDRGEDCPPDAHFFLRDKHPWITPPPGVPAFETLPGPDDPPLFAAAVLERLALAGSRLPG